MDRVPDPAGADLDQAWEHEWREHVSRSALERLKAGVSAKQCQMFDLHVLRGLSVPETARSLGVSVASVYIAKYRLSRLLRKHKEFLER